MFNILDLFSGIGGFSLGLERTRGFKTIGFCEIDPFTQKVLKKHWPDVPIYNDIIDLSLERIKNDGIKKIDVITGGFPCQDISTAGKQEGINAARSGLWMHLARLISEIQPRYAIVENVSALLQGPSQQRGQWFGRVLGDLAEIGYDAEWHCIPASAVGAPHRRDRIWIISYPASQRCSEAWKLRYSKLKKRLSCSRKKNISTIFSWSRDIESLQYGNNIPEPLIFGGRYGIPNWVDRIASCGNAVVPQITEVIGRAILETEQLQK